MPSLPSSVARTASLLALGLALVAPATAYAQAAEPLPVHGWVRADFETATLTPQGWVGITLPVSRATAIAIDGLASDTAAGFDVGPTFEMGSLYLAPMIGGEFAYAGGFGLTPQLLLAFEAPPLPIYIESQIRAGVRSPFLVGATDTLGDRTLVLITLAKWVALGFEHDGTRVLSGLADVSSDQYGLRTNFGITRGLTLGVFAGYEADAKAQARAEAGPAWLASRATLNFSF